MFDIDAAYESLKIYEQLKEENKKLKADIERKDRALNWIHNKIVAKSELYNYNDDLLRDIRVITEQTLLPMENRNVQE